jgi:hypothetical protein
MAILTGFFGGFAASAGNCCDDFSCQHICVIFSSLFYDAVSSSDCKTSNWVDELQRMWKEVFVA